MAEQPGFHPDPLTTFLSLPSELRQQTLFYTFYDAHLADLNQNYEIRQGGPGSALETPNISAWAHDLSSTHLSISDDVQFVADQWKITVISGWEDFCHTKLVQRVREACEGVKEKLRLQDEEYERWCLAWFSLDAERVTGGSGPEEACAALAG
ncbi:hypothetical protein E2P81_ATG02641 [Venturia nashicola]|nr:hypothetical protein E2P81_ATG02641 [Venturia nashicola]